MTNLPTNIIIIFKIIIKKNTQIFYVIFKFYYIVAKKDFGTFESERYLRKNNTPINLLQLNIRNIMFNGVVTTHIK